VKGYVKFDIRENVSLQAAIGTVNALRRVPRQKS
jgi:hypothetical protein